MAKSSTADLFRKALGQFPTGVVVVTTIRPDGHPVGLTVNSFNSVSLEPPMVLWSLQRHSPSLRAFIDAGRFAVSVLSHGQQTLSRRFANRHIVDKFDGVELMQTESGLPVLAQSVAYFECDRHTHTTVGDHELFVGLVRRFGQASELDPLLFVRGNYTCIGGPQTERLPMREVA